MKYGCRKMIECVFLYHIAQTYIVTVTAKSSVSYTLSLLSSGCMFKKWHNQLQDIFLLKRTDRSIAIGFSIGTFLAILPLFGLSVLVGVVIVLVWKKINKLALFGAMAIWNPFTLIPIYWLSFAIGDFFLDPLPVVEYKVAFLNQVYHFSRRFLLGNVLLAIVISLASYFLVKYVVRTYRHFR
jgi:uncharacterized protein